MPRQANFHVPPKPDPVPPESPPGDLPVDPDTDEPDIDLPPPEDPPVRRNGGGQGRKGSGLYRMRLLRGRVQAI
ncbi:hypothetical protein [Bordetella sp. 2513F-2]